MSGGKICLEYVCNVGKIYKYILQEHYITSGVCVLCLNYVRLTSCNMKLCSHTISEGHDFPNAAITLMAKGIIFLLHKQKW